MPPETEEFIQSHRVARLSTADAYGQPSVIPICYVFDRGAFYSALDQKPKSVPATGLKRVTNILANRKVSIVIDDYSDDWTKLAYVTVRGEAELLYPIPDSPEDEHSRVIAMLREKYFQYRSMAIEVNPVIKISVTACRLWRST